jgi:hypothetical protein
MRPYLITAKLMRPSNMKRFPTPGLHRLQNTIVSNFNAAWYCEVLLLLTQCHYMESLISWVTTAVGHCSSQPVKSAVVFSNYHANLTSAVKCQLTFHNVISMLLLNVSSLLRGDSFTKILHFYICPHQGRIKGFVGPRHFSSLSPL